MPSRRATQFAALRSTPASACRSRRRPARRRPRWRGRAPIVSGCAPSAIGHRRRAGRDDRRASDAAGSSALTPTTARRRPNSAQPAIRPACVPPDEEAWTITSGSQAGGGDLGDAAREARARRAAWRRRAESTNGGRPAARSLGRDASIAGARSSRDGDVADLGAEQTIEPALPVGVGWRRAVQHEHDPHAERGAGRGGDARVIRLHAAAGDQRVGARGRRLGGTVCILRTLLPPHAERQQVVALHEQRADDAARAPLRSRVSSSIGVGCGASGTTAATSASRARWPWVASY